MSFLVSPDIVLPPRSNLVSLQQYLSYLTALSLVYETDRIEESVAKRAVCKIKYMSKAKLYCNQSIPN